LAGTLARARAESLAEERQRQENAKYTPLSDSAAIEQWSEFRNNESKYRGTVTTWEFRVNNIGYEGNLMGWRLGGQGETHVAVEADERTVNVKENDWVIVTGRFSYVSRDGYVVLAPIRIKDEGVGQ
jgi:hypothetical protein